MSRALEVEPFMQQEAHAAFVEWAERKWPHAYGSHSLFLVHVSDACLAEAHAAYPPNADVEFGVCFKIAASH